MLQVIPRLTDPLAVQPKPCLSVFATERSWLILHLIGNDTRWFNATSGGWDTDTDYNCVDLLSTMPVVK